MSRITPQSQRDVPVRHVQATASDINTSTLPNASALPTSINELSQATAPSVGSQSISLEVALYGAITSNPDLVTLRQGNVIAASAEAVEVARHFPTTLNPTLWIDYRPITLVPNGTFGTGPQAGPHNLGYYHSGQNYITFH
jgi:hypothetical protein